MPKIRISDVLEAVDLPALRELAVHQLEAGHTRAEVIADIVFLVDAVVPWAVLLPGPAGAVVEAVDGPIAIAIATLVVGAADALRKRKAKRA